MIKLTGVGRDKLIEIIVRLSDQREHLRAVADAARAYRAAVAQGPHTLETHEASKALRDALAAVDAERTEEGK